MSIWNHQTLVLQPEFASLRPFMLSLPERFARGEGRLIHDGRNKLREIEFEGRLFVVKAFRRPLFINRLVYGIVRPSKAKRAYDNALLLRHIGVGTPQPVGYLNLRSGLLFDQSYLVTLASTCTHRYDELFERTFPYTADVMRAIARTTATLHAHGLAHLDYGRGNILFRRQESGHIDIELVDLNRMARGPLSLDASCRNMERLPCTPEMHRAFADEYARLRHFDADACFALLQKYRATQPGKVDGKY